MPPHKQVTSLQSSTLKLVAYLLRRLCCDWNVSTDKLQSVIDHLQVHIPPQIQALVCRTVLQYSTNKVKLHQLHNYKIYTDMYVK